MNWARGRAEYLAVCSSGNFATLTALSAPIAIILAAFAIDVGALYLEKRRLQSIADIAAISAAADIGRAKLVAKSVLRNNGLSMSGSEVIEGPIDPSSSDDCGLTVTTGTYAADPAIDAGRRFVPGGTSRNAVRVTVCHPGTRYFSAGLFPAPPISATATAATQAEAALSVGSRLVRLNGGVANALLGGLTGSTISLRAMDYEALLSAEVQLLTLLDALAIELDLDFATYDEVLRGSLTLREIAEALARSAELPRQARQSARRLARQIGTKARKIEISKLLDATSFRRLPRGATPPSGTNPQMVVMNIVSAAAVLSAANGKRQIALDLSGNATDLASARLFLNVGEPPQSAWFAVGGEQTIARTAQTRLLLEIGLEGSGLLFGTSIRLPIYAELAHATARIVRIGCPVQQGTTPEVTIAAHPGLARLIVGDVQPFALRPSGRSARLLSMPAIRVFGRADLEIANRNPTRLTFDEQDVAAGTPKSAANGEIARSLTYALLRDMEIDVGVAGSGLVTWDQVAQPLANALYSAAPAVDHILNSALATLGVSVGEADVRVHSASCGVSVLVQ